MKRVCRKERRSSEFTGASIFLVPNEYVRRKPAPWATLEDLLDKLFFEWTDPTFVGRFFLTYRRFATPRSILLGMQKRMIELSSISNDFMLASFAQMR